MEYGTSWCFNRKDAFTVWNTVIGCYHTVGSWEMTVITAEELSMGKSKILKSGHINKFIFHIHIKISIHICIYLCLLT